MNMQLPPRIQAQLQEADALEAAEKAAREQNAPRVQNVSDLVAVPSPEVAAPTPAPAPAAPTAPKEDFEHKYRVLQGMYEADVKALKASVRSLTENLTALTARPTEAPASAVPAIDPKDVEAFGDAMMEMVQRYVTGAVSALEKRIGDLEAQLGSVTKDTAQTKEQQFYALLDRLVPDWRSINEQEGWLKWLGIVDPVYGVPRQAGLDNAFRRLDAEQVARVFQAYVASIPPAPTPPKLDDQLTPDSAGNPTPPAAESKPILSERAITTFYNDLARGVYAGRQAEADALEAQINAAVAEGRVAR